MPFVRIDNLPGKVYVPPGWASTPRKHPCRDCHCCQMCSDDRCAVCRLECRPDERRPGKDSG
jgi:hypothetical protein